MNRNAFRTLVAIVSLVAAAAWLGAADKAHKLTTVSIRKMADSLHAVIAADQQAYAEIVAAPANLPPTSSAWPGHAALLRQAARSIQREGAEFSYTLRSLAPINPANAPQTAAEQTGLEFVRQHPGEAYTAEEELGGRSYFTAVYANCATAAACVECHNRAPESPRRDYRKGDVLGAIVVRVPLEF